ncbi:tRNA preQ1(34) S-adenosylmethionine ribosyltransferase-isomerase QueA [Terriglobus albidus]|uniref:S-adenosylmethionine:tRNA ribosyltransferase-isomerase n=1 Tax=Terriglobus albidus TaxID=1592106 RepID=A0A5B9EC84_9BACT|nr:tRNA preQ1(34) S-adenosylmethionine ribosyltransferase-isomerase QueA [Terriglobus albidus]QEE28071.1 tRNA preQ1(34) S-adenosylmethionine ribosyltransferase-isomerase QueA [Terriglobus albidus]
MLVSDFDFHLPEELIAQQPLPERDASRMLVLDRHTGAFRDDSFRSLPSLLRPGDLLVLNNSRVIPARLYATRYGFIGQIEVLLTQQTAPLEWTALVRPGKKVRVGTTLLFADQLQAEVIAAGEFGERTLRFAPVDDFFARLDRIGHIPLPPYMHRPDDEADRERYQTVYNQQPGSAAAPTAGLHFTPRVLDEVKARGVQIATITLHVGLGTFQPVRVERLDEIRLHTEHYTLPEETARAIQSAQREGRRIVAAGTTTVRTLEHCVRTSLEPHSGETNIFLSPGAEFKLVQALLTNFHLPQSTLLMLVSAFAGRENVLRAYNHAVVERYRFFSYGDCMFIA